MRTSTKDKETFKDDKITWASTPVFASLNVFILVCTLKIPIRKQTTTIFLI